MDRKRSKRHHRTQMRNSLKQRRRILGTAHSIKPTNLTQAHPVGCDSSHHSGMDWNVLGEYADYGPKFWTIGAKERGYVWDGMTALAAIEGANPGTGAASTGWDSPRARLKRGGTMPGLAEATGQTALPGGGALAWDSPLVGLGQSPGGAGTVHALVLSVAARCRVWRKLLGKLPGPAVAHSLGTVPGWGVWARGWNSTRCSHRDRYWV